MITEDNSINFCFSGVKCLLNSTKQFIMISENVVNLVRQALNSHDLTDCTIELQEGKTNKGDGYCGSIYFVTITGWKNNEQVVLDVVVKVSKDSEKLRQQIPIKETFLKEIFVYNEIKPVYEDFLKEKGLEALSIMPQCFGTAVNESSELLILENLKSQKYNLWDRTTPMTFDHIQLILAAFGRWHALSFAVKSQRPKIYEQLSSSKNSVNMFTYFLIKVNVLDHFVELFEEAKSTVFSSTDVNILEKLQMSKERIIYNLTDLQQEDPNYHVILHADCWNNNFLFKTEEFSDRPIDAKIIDWQCSGLASPVIDLSHFIYACCDTGKYKDVGELLKIYYASFHKNLQSFGEDPSEVYSYEKLVSHWSQFSCFGMILCMYVLQACLCQEEDIPDWIETAEQGKSFLDNMQYNIKNKEAYFKRAKDNLQHYVHNL